LLNIASGHGAAEARTLRDWFGESDAMLDPQAYVLRPDVVLLLSQAIIAESTAYGRARVAALATLEVLRKAHAAGEVDISEQDETWLETLSEQADELPVSEDALIAQVVPGLDRSKVRLEQYDIML
jgi:methanol--5-hydroxybenzimidazolylcobamide Co-methyltransferase